MTSHTILVGLVLAAGVLADRFAHHDELAARRFKELDPRVVGSGLDRSRNRRWHRAGTWPRMAVVVLLALLVAVATGSWVALVLAAVIAGGIVSLLFDILFNTRFGMDWYYTGTTAWTDQLLNKLNIGRGIEAGKLASGVEAAVVLVGVVAWLWIL